MKKSGKSFFVLVPVWDTFLFVVIGQTDDEFAKFAKRNKSIFPPNYIPQEFVGFKAGSVIIGGDGDPLGIRLFANPKRNIEALGAFNHELSHYVQLVLDFRGMIRTRESEEAYAYLTSYLTRAIFKKL